MIYLGRCAKCGGSHHVNLPPKVRELMGLNHGDVLGMRVVGALLIMEKVPLQKIAAPSTLPVQASMAAAPRR